MGKLQTYQKIDLTKEIKLLGKVTTLGEGRFIITIAKKDNDKIEPFKGETVIMTLRMALEE